MKDDLAAFEGAGKRLTVANVDLNETDVVLADPRIFHTSPLQIVEDQNPTGPNGRQPPY
jgi:hypothetical protein